MATFCLWFSILSYDAFAAGIDACGGRPACITQEDVHMSADPSFDYFLCYDLSPVYTSVLFCNKGRYGLAISAEIEIILCPGTDMTSGVSYAQSQNIYPRAVSGFTDKAYPYICGPGGWCYAEISGPVGKYVNSATVEGGECYQTLTSTNIRDPHSTTGNCAKIVDGSICRTPEYCKNGYYKEGDTCKPCPENGKSEDHNTADIYSCYVSLAPGEDSSGSYTTTSTQCNYSG